MQCCDFPLSPSACRADLTRLATAASETTRPSLIARVTEAMVAVEGEKMRPVTWVRVQEIESGDRAIGGKPLEASDVRALAAGKAG
jgi:4-oxalocrotonate tautomerase